MKRVIVEAKIKIVLILDEDGDVNEALSTLELSNKDEDIEDFELTEIRVTDSH